MLPLQAIQIYNTATGYVKSTRVCKYVGSKVEGAKNAVVNTVVNTATSVKNEAVSRAKSAAGLDTFERVEEIWKDKSKETRIKKMKWRHRADWVFDKVPAMAKEVLWGGTKFATTCAVAGTVAYGGMMKGARLAGVAASAAPGVTFQKVSEAGFDFAVNATTTGLKATAWIAPHAGNVLKFVAEKAVNAATSEPVVVGSLVSGTALIYFGAKNMMGYVEKVNVVEEGGAEQLVEEKRHIPSTWEKVKGGGQFAAGVLLIANGIYTYFALSDEERSLSGFRNKSVEKACEGITYAASGTISFMGDALKAAGNTAVESGPAMMQGLGEGLSSAGSSLYNTTAAYMPGLQQSAIDGASYIAAGVWNMTTHLGSILWEAGNELIPNTHPIV